jgi:hypothetical protein
MKNRSRILTVVAGGVVALALGILTPVAGAGAADRTAADATRLNPSYWPQGTGPGRQEPLNRAGTGSDYHADYHADYRARRDEPAAGSSTRDADASRPWRLTPDTDHLRRRSPDWRR